jgi:hypothetical protein
MHTPRFVRPALLSFALLAALSTLASAAGRAHATPAGSKPVLRFIDDDYSRALAEARARKLPLFIESWAPW